MTRLAKVFRVLAVLLIVYAVFLGAGAVFLLVSGGMLGRVLDGGDYQNLVVLGATALLAAFFDLAAGISGLRFLKQPHKPLFALIMASVALGNSFASLLTTFSSGNIGGVIFGAAVLLIICKLASDAVGGKAVPSVASAASTPDDSAAPEEPAVTAKAAEPATPTKLAAPAAPATPIEPAAPAESAKATPLRRKRGLPRGSVRWFALSSCAVVLVATIAFFALTISTRSVVAPLYNAPATAQTTAVAAAADGTITIESPYVSDVTGITGDSKLTITWNDAWFDADPTVYNHELAAAAMALATVANSEAFYYDGSGDETCYLEDCLTQLGFSQIDSTAYLQRSQAVDEIADLFEGKTDVVAYGMARKQISAADGTSRTLVLVTIRGTWGAEWLSDFRLLGGEEYGSNAGAQGNAATDAQEGTTSGAQDTAVFDASGFSRAADKLLERLTDYCTDLDPATTSILICGHSRGGSVTNIVGARLNERATAQSDEAPMLAPANAIFAYGFAVSRTTQSSLASDAGFDNLFSVNSPSDVVANIPLTQWGYTRYGVTYLLPSDEVSGYDEMVPNVQSVAASAIGAPLPTNFYVRDKLETFLELEAAAYSTAEEALKPAAIIGLAYNALRSGIPQVIDCHLPDAYLAWMNTIDDTDLTQE